MSAKTAMIALGGNALSPKAEVGTIYQQFAHTRESLDGIMHFIDRGYNLCITHGNGPQVGDELLRMDLTHDKLPPLPLGICVASTQGTIGYMVQQSLQNRLRKVNIDREVVTIVTQVIVNPNDPSIKNPTKFIGHTYSYKKIKPMAEKFGWVINQQNPGEWRRVVPSPLPEYIMHGKSIKALVDRGTIVLAAGGGGIPVYVDENHNLEGLDAVIDKDYAASKLGHIIIAQELWIITDVDCVYLNYNQPDQKPLLKLSYNDANKYLNDRQFQKGSMAPKIKAALYFLKHDGKKVVITSIPKIKEALEGKAGTTIVKSE